MDQMTDKDLGQMYLVYGKALVARSSTQILFFRIEIIEDENGDDYRIWKQYHCLEHGGFISFMKGNIRIQIVTDEMIYFYLINEKTLLPELENSFTNYMNCSQMLFGRKVRYCIAYKTNQKSFEIYTRKYMHNFKLPVSQENLEGSKSLEFTDDNIFLVTKVD